MKQYFKDIFYELKKICTPSDVAYFIIICSVVLIVLIGMTGFIYVVINVLGGSK